MHIGKVIGTVVATRKDDNLIGCKLMVVQPLNSKLEPEKEELVAVDTVGAGIGETIVYTSGTAARIGAKRLDSPIDLSIVGIVDTINVEEE